MTAAEFKLARRQVVASVLIRATKQNFVAEGTTLVHFAHYVASTCNTVFCRETSWSRPRVIIRPTMGFNLIAIECRTIFGVKISLLSYNWSKFFEMYLFSSRPGIINTSEISLSFETCFSFETNELISILSSTKY